jgi:hypothetical protein
MTDFIYNYPKSSCVCTNCDKNPRDEFLSMKGNPTNMSVTDCNFSDYFDCNPTHVFKTQQEPVSGKHGHHVLNPSVIGNDKHSPYYKEIDAKKCPGSACPGTTYLNSDARLYNAVAGTWLQLDRPPLYSTPKLNTLSTDNSLNNYGKGYKSYGDVNAGQILYYIDKATEDAFYEPLYSTKAMSIGTLYQDPMGAIKPQWERVPNEKYDPILGNKCHINEYVGSSFMKDSQFHREDLLALQMRKHNETRYPPRYSNLPISK